MMAERNGEPQRVTNRASEGLTPSSVSKLESWPHVGIHDDVLRICSERTDYISAWFEPHCPRCRRSRHPNVTRSRDDSSQRHCNRCKIRWSALFQPFCSCHGQPEGVLSKLIIGLVRQTNNVYDFDSDPKLGRLRCFAAA